jgi:hypothetical protein
VDVVRREVLGKSGTLSRLRRGVVALPPEERRTARTSPAPTSLEGEFPAAVIWFGRATGTGGQCPRLGRRAQLLEAESPSALTAARGRAGTVALPVTTPGNTALNRHRDRARGDAGAADVRDLRAPHQPSAMSPIGQPDTPAFTVPS